MKERPIIFSGPMVRAILDGTKTQTRRVVKPTTCGPCAGDGPRFDLGNLPFFVGQHLWVRESWAPVDYLVATELEDPVCIGYRATETAICHEDNNVRPMDTYAFPWDRIKWRPSIHMPRWASRIDLEVTSVRVERVQEISEEDARAEGMRPRDPSNLSHRSAFIMLWDEINGDPHGKTAKSWADNPWVWVIGFRRVRP